MPTQGLEARIRRAEQTAKAQSKFTPECICFPEHERPCFHFPIEEQIAGQVKCPLHGERFKPTFFIFVAQWLKEKRERLLLTHHSAQYRRAWAASFPDELWPAQ